MGVQGLWVLLEPVGRRVNIETLTNKRLAVDASIWIYQFMQTMRDSQGEMLRNAHLVGFLRRICRLLFHRVRPVFVFDGATPPLKRRTIIARRRRREQQTAKVRKTAEKLLLAQLKKYALQTQLQGGATKAAAPAQQQQPDSADGDGADVSGSVPDVEAGPSLLPDTSGDAMLAQQLAAEMQRGSYAQDMASHLEAGDAEAVGRLALQAVEAMTSSLPTIKEDEEDKEEEDEEAGADEEVVLPEGMELDPVVMSTLPPSMQLDLLTKMRENKIYENREKFARHANQPASFSSLQMQEYLKASAFRRKIEDVKDALNASAAAGGAVAKRIAGEEGREYILQRHDTGEKQQPSADVLPQQLVAKAVAAGSNVEISLDLTGTGGLDINDLLLKSPQEQTQEVSTDEEWENVDTGEPVSETKIPGVPSVNKRPADWRERKAQRQKYWSLSQGFRFGRKLADWGGLDGDGGEEGDGGSAPGVDDTEDAQMQEAIRRSLMDAPGAETTAAQDSEDESEQIWQHAQASDDARPSREAGTSAGPSGAQQSSQIPSHINELSARRLEAPSDAAAPPAADSVDKGLLTKESDQAGPAKAVGSSRAVSNGDAGQHLVERRHDSHASNGAEQLKAHARDSASAAALRKALQAAEDEIVILDYEVESNSALKPNQSAAHAVQSLQDGQRRTEATDAAAANTVPEKSGPQVLPGHRSGSMPARAAPSDQVGAVGPGAAPAGGAGVGPGFFGGQRPVLERDPEDKMPLIPVLLGRQAVPDLPVKKDEDISAPEQAVSKPMPADSQGAAVSTGPQGPPIGSSLRQQQPQHSLQASKASAVSPGESAAAASSADGVQKEHINGTSAAPSVSVRDQRGPKASSPHEDAQARAAAEDERMQEERKEDDAPVQYSRDPWAHDPWGQGDLWEDPEQGNSMLALEPTPAAINAAFNQPPPPAQAEEPVNDPTAFNLEQELADLEKETKTLRAANKRTAGTNEAPTTDMHGDCQELLQLFGLPYIIAPSEAEAQCAWLDANGLVDGVVTDDNDVFLFGAKHVYRHIFENRKYVEEYRTEDVERELGLDQEGLIRLALLLGSDYTEGVGGIGIVNAVETVRAFRGEDGMRKFRDWVLNPDEEELLAAVRPQRKRKRKKQVKAGGEGADAEDEQEEAVPDPYAGEDPEIAEYKRKHRNMRKNWELPSSFPDARVIEAYRKASVDDSKERFTHGRPDAELLRNFCKEKFNWGPDKVDEILEPVLKAYDARQAQLTMDTFLTFNERFAKIKSKRLAKAVKGISKATHPELLLEDGVDEPAPKRRRASKQAPTEQQQLGVFGDKSESDEELLAAIEAVDPSTQPPARSRGRGSCGMQKQGGRQVSSTRGRGRGGGRGRGRGRAKKHSGAEPEEEISLADSSSSEDAAEAVEQRNKEGKSTKHAAEAGESDDEDWEPAA